MAELTDVRIPSAAYTTAALALTPDWMPWSETAWTADGWRIGGCVARRVRFADATVHLDDRGGSRIEADDEASVMPESEGRTIGWSRTYVDDDAVWVRLGGQTYVIQRRKPKQKTLAEGEAALVSPMPGSVVAVAVADGDLVEVGQHVLSVEAMKMEHRLTATQAGVVRLEVTAGEQVTRGQLLAHIESEGE